MNRPLFWTLSVMAIAVVWLLLGGCATKAQVYKLNYDMARAVGKSEILLRSTQLRNND